MTRVIFGAEIMLFTHRIHHVFEFVQGSPQLKYCALDKMSPYYKKPLIRLIIDIVNVCIAAHFVNSRWRLYSLFTQLLLIISTIKSDFHSLLLSCSSNCKSFDFIISFRYVDTIPFLFLFVRRGSIF